MIRVRSPQTVWLEEATRRLQLPIGVHRDCYAYQTIRPLVHTSNIVFDFIVTKGISYMLRWTPFQELEPYLVDGYLKFPPPPSAKPNHVSMLHEYAVAIVLANKCIGSQVANISTRDVVFALTQASCSSEDVMDAELLGLQRLQYRLIGDAELLQERCRGSLLGGAFRGTCAEAGGAAASNGDGDGERRDAAGGGGGGNGGLV
jgi:hypothetical protein